MMLKMSSGHVSKEFLDFVLERIARLNELLG